MMLNYIINTSQQSKMYVLICKCFVIFCCLLSFVFVLNCFVKNVACKTALSSYQWFASLSINLLKTELYCYCNLVNLSLDTNLIKSIFLMLLMIILNLISNLKMKCYVCYNMLINSLSYFTIEFTILLCILIYKLDLYYVLNNTCV